MCQAAEVMIQSFTTYIRVAITHTASSPESRA
jgi:hypothetical protein